MNMPQGPGGPPQGYPGGPPQGPPSGPHPFPGQPGHPGPQGQPGQHPTVQFVPHGPPPPKPARPKVFTTIWTLGLISLAGVVLGISLDENGQNAWHSVHAWGGLAILGAALTLAPVLGHAFGLTPQRAAQVAACGAGALVLYWVLFVLPVVGSNTSLLTTIGAAAGGIAAWIAPGRDPVGPGAGPQGHSW